MKDSKCVRPREAALILCVAVCGACDIATIRPIEDPDAGSGNTSTSSRSSKIEFDPDSYVLGIWESKLLPAVRSGATEFQAANASISKEGGPRFALARARGKVTSVEDRGRSRQVGVDLDPADGKPDVWVQIGGPDGVDGNAVRDGSGVVSFDHFTNQIQFAYVATALGKHIESKVVAPISAGIQADATLEVSGVLFQVFEEKGPVPVIAPVSLTVEAPSK